MRRRRGLEVGVALVIGAVLGIGSYLVLPVGGSGASGPPVEVAGAVAVRRTEVTSEHEIAAERSVLRVEASGCGERRQASATMVRTSSGRVLLLTNAHVVRGSGTATVWTVDGTSVSVDVDGSLQGRDVAVLDAAPVLDAATTVEPLAVGPEVGVGDDVVVVGHPAARLRLDGSGVLEIERRAAFDTSSDVLLLDSSVTGGSSGGAVLDRRARAVGLVAARDPGTGHAVAYPLSDVLDRTLVGIPRC